MERNELKLRNIIMLGNVTGKEISFKVFGKQDTDADKVINATNLELKVKDGNITGIAKTFEKEGWTSAPITTSYDELVNNPKYKIRSVVADEDKNYNEAFFDNFLANLPLLIRGTDNSYLTKAELDTIKQTALCDYDYETKTTLEEQKILLNNVKILIDEHYKLKQAYIKVDEENNQAYLDVSKVQEDYKLFEDDSELTDVFLEIDRHINDMK